MIWGRRKLDKYMDAEKRNQAGIVGKKGEGRILVRRCICMQGHQSRKKFPDVLAVPVLHDSHGIMPPMDIMEFHGCNTFS